MFKNSLVAAAACLALVAAGASAQNYNLSPSYGGANLSAGFSPDPWTVSITAGGQNDAGRVGCAGYVADAPDYRVNYSAGGFSLYFSVQSGADTTLVINAPDGRWYCNDDYNGLNPAVIFGNPMSGQYDIWIGTFDYGSLPSSTLYVSEVGTY